MSKSFAWETWEGGQLGLIFACWEKLGCRNGEAGYRVLTAFSSCVG